MVSNFDLKFVEWTESDRSVSTRAAVDDINTRTQLLLMEGTSQEVAIHTEGILDLKVYCNRRHHFITTFYEKRRIILPDQ